LIFTIPSLLHHCKESQFVVYQFPITSLPSIDIIDSILILEAPLPSSAASLVFGPEEKDNSFFIVNETFKEEESKITSSDKISTVVPLPGPLVISPLPEISDGECTIVTSASNLSKSFFFYFEIYFV